MQVLNSHQVQWNYQTLQIRIYKECFATASALPSNLQSSDPTALHFYRKLYLLCLFSFLMAAWILWYNVFNQADLMKQTIPSSLSPQATFCQTPKILAVPFSLPCGLGIAWFQQTCTSCYWNLELQWFCNHPSTSSTQTDVPHGATAVALKTFSLRITC